MKCQVHFVSKKLLCISDSPWRSDPETDSDFTASAVPCALCRMTGGGVAVQPHQERADVFRSGATEIPEPQSKGIHGDEDRVEEGDELDPDDLLEDLEDLDEAGIAEEPAEALGQERSAPWRRSISIAARRRAIRANAQRWAGAGAAVARAAVGPLLKRREMLQDQQGIPVDFLLKARAPSSPLLFGPYSLIPRLPSLSRR